MKLTVTTLLGRDGVVQAPGGPAEDRTGVFAGADAFMLGRLRAGKWS